MSGRSLADVNPNERMKFHLRKRRYSSNDVDHRRYHDVLQHDQKISPSHDGVDHDQGAPQSLTQETFSHKHRHEEEYHEPVYEIHLYEHPPPPPQHLHHHHTNSQILPVEGSHKHELSLKDSSQHLHRHEHSTPLISPAGDSIKHPFHSIKVEHTPRAEQQQSDHNFNNHLVAKVPEEHVVSSAQASRISKPGF